MTTDIESMHVGTEQQCIERLTQVVDVDYLREHDLTVKDEASATLEITNAIRRSARTSTPTRSFTRPRTRSFTRSRTRWARSSASHGAPKWWLSLQRGLNRPVRVSPFSGKEAKRHRGAACHDGHGDCEPNDARGQRCDHNAVPKDGQPCQDAKEREGADDRCAPSSRGRILDEPGNACGKC